ncbi:putative TonB-dependent receptor [Sphingomonas changbaiensis NBRC 104936]|uniref:Putative TonB-dependent receptor n=1 Tax=Sphingomonas changbaiensis NBRC 104936 TaxID=1219043 RepID=A0A0E9MLQ7_9SPHN|nr:TonB-dependent receptor [Sphingomonas changbaiensis]GAO38423.1 putative TonB-dependent receptor [Sphingomonas changbaiensis NBRC 104936]
MARFVAVPLVASALVLAFPPGALRAQSRTGDNAVTQAQDAFGYSVGRESLGIYDAGNVRGFSPTDAGNLRIDGLYFAPVVGLSGLVVDSQSIKVGLSAQGYPFAAPSGIVDQRLRRPADRPGASVLLNTDSYGSAGVELNGSLPVLSSLSLGVGLNGGRTHFADGTSNYYHSEALIGRWHPSPGIEVLPFWSAFTDIDDESSIVYIPAGQFLPPEPRPGHYPGPRWNGINRTHFNFGVLASASLSPDWLLQVGLFRSLRHLRNGYTYLIADIGRDGTGRRTIFADPPVNKSGNSGEVRLTHTIAEGKRLHTAHFSVRGRTAERDYGGADEIDIGTSSIYQDIDTPRPQFRFGALSHDRLRQWIYGIAYDGRWKGVGELSFGLSKSVYRKSSVTPDQRIVSRWSPLLYNGTLTLLPFHGVAVYGGYSRGFEESGSPPANATNRNEALPAIITRQTDAGVRVDVTSRVKAVAGVFELSRPYFGFDETGNYVPIGTTRNRGMEFSLSGNLTDRLRIVAGGVLLDAKVQVPRDAASRIGRHPVGIPAHIFNLDANWDVAAVRGLSFDAALSQRGRTPATTDNAVDVPPRTQLDLGGRYAFSIGGNRATARLQIGNLFDARGFGVAGPGAYYPNSARSASAYLTIDL